MEYFGPAWKKKFSSVLAAYARKYDCVEVNSTFYKIPSVSTAAKWLAEARAVNPKFVFTVKCSQLVTHAPPFGAKSVYAFRKTLDVCKALEAKVLLLQSPAGFKPTAASVSRMRAFFKKTARARERAGVAVAWEPRGDWWKNPALVKKTCEEFDLVNCVDPLRNEPQYFGKEKIAYYRLHGFGRLSVYNYRFSQKELLELKKKIGALKKGRKCAGAWVFFNNVYCYENALEFKKLARV
ncbi:DUF72 domain-containing protein [Candidatus Micrarchaeota archaeon]|nr:DUF72 domain-containing protein [Candidatus Micrarchaeota archaeon]